VATVLIIAAVLAVILLAVGIAAALDAPSASRRRAEIAHTYAQSTAALDREAVRRSAAVSEAGLQAREALREASRRYDRSVGR
jgi:Flp pilus assembly protein TadB